MTKPVTSIVKSKMQLSPNSWRRGVFLTLLVAATVGAFGCKDAETRIDCASVCDRYKDCFDDNYDADKCADNCVDHADDADRQDQVDMCDSCIDGESCTGAAFSCADECVGIVP